MKTLDNSCLTDQEFEAVKQTMLQLICTNQQREKTNCMTYLQGFKGLCIHKGQRNKLKNLKQLEVKFGIDIRVPWLEEGRGA
jgi:hypothetical protein